VGAAAQVEQLPRLMTAEPDIAILDLAASALDTAVVIHQVREMCPRCEVILTAAPEVQFDLSDAVMAGARGLIRKPISSTQLLGIIYRVFEAEQIKRYHLEHRAKPGERGLSGEIIAIYSPKGGVGCTTIASNLALALTGQSKVALVDFDLQFGDVDVLLDLHSSHGVHELMRSTDDLDSSILDAVMVKHRSGLSVLLPPPTLDHVEQLTPEGLIAVLKALRKNYDLVIVDTWHAIEDITLAVMDLANTILIVTTPEIPALRDTRRLLEMIEKRPESRNKTQVVINRYPSKSSVSIINIERSLGMKCTATIPSDGVLITGAVNEGVAFIQVQSEATNNLKQLASDLAHRQSTRLSAPQATKQQVKKRSFSPFKRTHGAQGVESPAN
jgi:pilus assembly protein CpaE